jgi:hypothetical protein
MGERYGAHIDSVIASEAKQSISMSISPFFCKKGALDTGGLLRFARNDGPK